jgi:predicted TIM-barrel fold metal-dependent hydrolase
MALNGYRIFDSDTHAVTCADILEKYLSASEKAKLKGWEQWKWTDPVSGHSNYMKGARKYLRKLGSATPDAERPRVRRFDQARKNEEPSLYVDDDPAERIKDMDREGVDVNLTLPSGWFGTFTTGDDVALEFAMYRAYHRWMAEYCSAYPKRIKGVILVCYRDLEASLRELEHCAKQDWPLGVFVIAPAEVPLDHPALEPVWAACQNHDLAVTLHTFTNMPPYAPGGLDTWDSHWIQRIAAHSWCGQRNMSSLLGAGLMDRYPKLRIGVLEAGHGWLPFWMARMDEHARSLPSALPPLTQKPSEYVMGGRYFQSIEMSEGERLTRAVIDMVGEDVLMYASDYPHGESWFPKSVETVMAWKLPESAKRKLFWDNAVRLYARYPRD